MNDNEELLLLNYQNARMGEIALKPLIEIVEDEGYKNILQSQLNEYQMICSEAEQELEDRNKDVKLSNKVSSYIMINLKTLSNKTPSHISEMLIQGSTMGVIDITKKMKQYSNAEDRILNLADKLLKFEERNIEECKTFL